MGPSETRARFRRSAHEPHEAAIGRQHGPGRRVAKGSDGGRVDEDVSREHESQSTVLEVLQLGRLAERRLDPSDWHFTAGQRLRGPPGPVRRNESNLVEPSPVRGEHGADRERQSGDHGSGASCRRQDEGPANTLH